MKPKRKQEKILRGKQKKQYIVYTYRFPLSLNFFKLNYPVDDVSKGRYLQLCQ